MGTHLGNQIANAVRARNIFHAYGGWELTTFKDQYTGSVIDELRVLTYLMAGMHADSGATLKLVEVEIYNPVNNSYEYLQGIANGKIPPHDKRHRDGDCEVRVEHVSEIRSIA